jgi:toxin ParE1/3/4
LTERSVSLHPEALDEAVAATEWYAKRSRRAAESFLDEMDRMIVRLSENAGQFPTFDFGTRRAMLRRFPWPLVFRETSSGLEVIAVVHSRRRPGYWRNRV